MKRRSLIWLLTLVHLCGTEFAWGQSKEVHLKAWMIEKQTEADRLPKRELSDNLKQLWKMEAAIKLMDYSRIEVQQDTHKYVFSRVSILLKDQSFVSSISSSLEVESEDIMEVTVFHANGSKRVYTMTDALSNEVSLVLPGGEIIQEVSKFKFSLKGLGVGDIVRIDQAHRSNLTQTLADKHIKSEFFFHRLNEDIPVLNRQIDFEITPPVLLNWRSLNQAPELSQLASNNNAFHYRFVDSIRHAQKQVAYSKGIKTEPTIKFALALKTMDLEHADLVSRAEATQPYDENDICRYATNMYSDRKASESDFYLKFFKTIDPELIKSGDYMAREFLKQYRIYYSAQTGNFKDYDNEHFVRILSRTLRKFGIPFYYQVCLPKQLGHLDEMVSLKELHWAVVFQEDGAVLSNFDFFGEVNKIAPQHYLAPSLLIEPGRRRSKVISSPLFGQEELAQVAIPYREVNWKIKMLDEKAEVSRHTVFSGYINHYQKSEIASSLLYDQLLDHRYYYLMGTPFLYENRENQDILSDLNLSYEVVSNWEKSQYKDYFRNQLIASGIQVKDFQATVFEPGNEEFKMNEYSRTDYFTSTNIFKRMDTTARLIELEQLLPDFTQEGWQEKDRSDDISIPSNFNFKTDLEIHIPWATSVFQTTLRDTTFSNAIGSISVRVGPARKNIEKVGADNSWQNIENQKKFDRVMKDKYGIPIKRNFSAITPKPTLGWKKDGLLQNEGINKEPKFGDFLKQSITIEVIVNEEHFTAESWAEFQEFLRFYNTIRSQAIYTNHQ